MKYTLRLFARVSVAMRARYGFVHTRRFNVPARGKERSSGEEDVHSYCPTIRFPGVSIARYHRALRASTLHTTRALKTT